MNDETNQEPVIAGEEPTVVESETAAPATLTERQQSTTVGTGSYVAISCTVMALLLTFGLLGLLFVARWLGWG